MATTSTRSKRDIRKKYYQIRELLDKIEDDEEYGTGSYDRDGQEFDLGYIAALAWCLGIELKGGTKSRVEQFVEAR